MQGKPLPFLSPLISSLLDRNPFEKYLLQSQQQNTNAKVVSNNPGKRKRKKGS